ncbi:MAG: tetratricopeptide repeat protein [Lentimicrobium sp.]|jgi:tetratricopeptide (TPR) repeat protein|nr:tetratricopeptide repeat protein [Lentimicrobiaceae bacterium]MDY0026896.1 tetratricopeptide repeat protein [Lentimicrobium sp.]
MKKLILFLLFFGLLIQGFGQNERGMLRQGNKLYEDEKFNEAEIEYRKALEKAQTSVKGNYNLGNALYKQEKFDEAVNSLSNANAMIKETDTQLKAKALHNLGNALLKADKLPESIEAYKQSLRLNPADNDTRYNLAYAMQKLQQQQQQQQSQNNQDNKDKNDDKNQQQNQKDQQQDDQQDQDQQQQKPQISKQDAERMLQALKNDEQKTLDKVNRQKVKATNAKVEKDW